MSELTTTAETAWRFAAALDAEDYGSALRCLATKCLYEARHELIAGAEAIVAGYRGMGESAHRRFDKFEYSCTVTAYGSESATIRFTDRMTLGVRDHHMPLPATRPF